VIYVLAPTVQQAWYWVRELGLPRNACIPLPGPDRRIQGRMAEDHEEFLVCGSWENWEKSQLMFSFIPTGATIRTVNGEGKLVTVVMNIVAALREGPVDVVTGLPMVA
jgi:hypothetical protein